MSEHEWMSDLDAIVEQRVDARAIVDASSTAASEPPTEQQPQTQHVYGNRWDDHLYDRAVRDVSTLSSAIDEYSARYAPTDALARDLYRALFKSDMQTQDVDAEHARNAKALDECFGTDDFTMLRELTRLDAFAAATAAATLTRKLAATLAQQQQDDEREQQQQQQPRGEQSGDGEQSGASGDGDESAEQQQAQARAHALREQQQQQVLRNAAREAAQAAQAEIESENAAADAFDQESEPGGWGHGNGRTSSEGDMRARAKLASQIARDPRLQAIAKLAGRMQQIATGAQERKAEHVPEMIHDIETGDDVARALATELALLADEDTEMLALAHLAERGMLQYELRGTEPQGRGPIVLCVDESGSMRSQVEHGVERRDYAAAIMLALMTLARKQSRDFAVIHYAGTLAEANKDTADARGACNVLTPLSTLGVKSGEYPALHTETFAKGRASVEQTMRAALHWFNGGNEDYVLSEALTIVERAEYKRADVIVLTDGQWNVRPDVLARWDALKRQRDFRAYGLMIGPMHEARSMHAYCDSVVNVSEPGQRDESALSSIFGL